jgi:hypothetical protein
LLAKPKFGHFYPRIPRPELSEQDEFVKKSPKMWPELSKTMDTFYREKSSKKFAEKFGKNIGIFCSNYC